MLYHAFNEILDSEKNNNCIICAHGPSSEKYISKIEDLQKNNTILRFSVNSWWEYFSIPPDYFCLANSLLTIDKFIDKFLVKTIFYADSADLTPRVNIQNSKINIFGYDQRHFGEQSCKSILRQRCNHVDVCNNRIMWDDGRDLEYAGFDPDGRCCKHMLNGRKTIQEYLMDLCGTNQHYSTGDTVVFHAIAFAIILGCNPIYVAGMDLNYSLGYINNQQAPYINDEWRKYKRNTINDLEILQKSAQNRGIEIINLTSDPWYGTIFPLRNTIAI